VSPALMIPTIETALTKGYGVCIAYKYACTVPRTDVMILKIFSPKNSAKKLAFLTQNKAKLCKIWIIPNIGVWEKRQFFAENCRKSQKIVIITSTPRPLYFWNLWSFCKHTHQ
jgi:hypothetical protein